MTNKVIFFLLFLILTFGSSTCYSQILFNNPSFENIAPCNQCVPPGWDVCKNSPDNNYYHSPFPPPSDASLYMGIISTPINVGGYYEAFGQFLNCHLTQNNNYLFYADLRSLRKIVSNRQEGIVQIYGGIDSCDAYYLLWESPVLDSTKWIKYKIEFNTPININFITFVAKCMDEMGSAVLIDNLSPIYCTNFNQIHLATSNDTSITKGECVTLNANATAGYDSIYWQSIPAAFSSATLNAGEVCPAQSTIYIVAIRDTGCGSFWSYDTLRVEVTVPDAPIMYGPDNNGAIQIISNDDGYFILYDLLGRTVEKIPVVSGIQTITLGKYYLSPSMYIADIEAANKSTVRKLIWVK